MRDFIQSKLSEIVNLDCGELIPDDVIEDNITYFGYMLTHNLEGSDFEENFTYNVVLTGYVIRRKNAEENTTKIVDDMTEEIINKLKEINFRSSYQDVSIDNNIQKIRISGNGRYNEINNKIV